MSVRKYSGKWRAEVMVDRKRLSASFTNKTDANLWVAQMKAKKETRENQPGKMTLEQAYDRYIEERSNILSPSSVMGYNKLKRNTFKDLMPMLLGSITPQKVQMSVNKMAAEGKSPKYIRSAHGLLTPVLKEFAPGIHLDTMLPSKQKPTIEIPTSEEVKAVLRQVKGTAAELPISLAVYMGLRASEISGLTWDCVKGDALEIKQARVRGEDGLYMKDPKTYSGYRTIHIPEEVKALLDAAPKVSKYIVNMSPHAIYHRFARACEKAGVKHYRLHALRHYHASVMLAAGVPTAYMVDRMGHGSEKMIREVYGHIMASKKDEVTNTVEKEFRKKL